MVTRPGRRLVGLVVIAVDVAARAWGPGLVVLRMEGVCACAVTASIPLRARDVVTGDTRARDGEIRNARTEPVTPTPDAAESPLSGQRDASAWTQYGLLMGRSNTAEKQTKPVRKKPAHALFPTLDAALISSLWVYRMIKHRGGKLIPELLVGPLDPASLTNEAHLKAYGPGLLRVIARRSDGPLLGDPFEMRFPDERGRVPMEEADFDVEGGAVGDSAETAAMKRLLHEEREQMRRLREEERSLNAANMQTFSAIIDKITEGNASVVERILSAQRAPSASEVPPWVRDELRDVKRQLATTQKSLHEKEMAFFKLETKKAPKEGDESDPMTLLKKYGPIIDFVGKFFEEKNSAPATPPAGAQPATDENSVVINGERIPSIAMLRAVMAQNSATSVADVLSDHAVASFRRLHAAGMLPPAYVELLGAVLA